MTLVIACPCGQTVRSESEDELVSLATRHAQEVHNQTPTREQILSMAKPED
ncbi:MAG: DUF1059 domain-containing protein [Chloroflexi bacterium]|nr:DUF1059 domain-containing protein [Chloroflexota bacterium]